MKFGFWLSIFGTLAPAFIQPPAVRAAGPDTGPANAAETRTVAGWTVHVSPDLMEKQSGQTRRALELLDVQLKAIVREVPSNAVGELQKVPLYFSPPYTNARPRAEFHPSERWLRANGRDPVMAGGVEFTEIAGFERSMDRMPNFALHELAHAYHFHVLRDGFGNEEIKAAYERAKKSGTYDRVERWLGSGRKNTFERAYAMTNPQEYFAECTEAFFVRNDFFPFTLEELKKHDPDMFALLQKVWHVVP